MITIAYIGSNMVGDKSASIDELINVLATTPLDPSFENYGDFVHPAVLGEQPPGSEFESDSPIYPDAPDALRFWGNFAKLSFGFNIDTDEPELINRLTTAIRDNQATPAYLAAKQALKIRNDFWAEREHLNLANQKQLHTAKYEHVNA